MGEPAQQQEQRWYTTAEAAVYLRLSVGALRAQIMRGNIKPDSLGGRGRLKGHRFQAGTLERFLRGEKAA